MEHTGRSSENLRIDSEVNTHKNLKLIEIPVEINK